MSVETELVQYEGAAGVTLWRKPEQVLAEAKEAATALISVISQKKNKVMFNGEQYIEREDWGTVAKFYGCTAKIIETRFVNYDGVRGFEAIAVCLDHNQNEISRAESMCLADEANWGDVPVYEWQDELDAQGKKIWVDKPGGGKRPKGKRVQVGTAPKPLFQLRSMAQTRAEAKVLKSVFGYVVVLAGYRPSVAEEMTGNEFDDRQEGVSEPEQKTPVKQPSRQSDAVLKDVSGIIAEPKLGKGEKRTIWLKVGEDLLTVSEEFLGKDKFELLLNTGWHLKAKVKQYKSEQVGVYWVIVEFGDCTAVQEGEVVDPKTAADGTKTYFDTEAPAAEEPTAKAGEGLGDLFAEGAVRPASQIPNPEEANKPGTIGLKRAQRLRAIVTQNYEKTGFTHKDLDGLVTEFKLKHLRDLPVSAYEGLEHYADGTTPFPRD